MHSVPRGAVPKFLLTALLLMPDPAAATGVEELPPPLDEHLTHFLLLAALGFLAFASRWPLGARVLLAALLIYAVAVEVLQTLTPPRAVELKDLVENVLGVTAGGAAWRLVERTRFFRGRG